MIGAILMLLCIAIVFLTRPDKQRNYYIKKFTLIISRYFMKQINPTGNQSTTTSSLSKIFVDQISSPVRLVDYELQHGLSGTDEILKTFPENIISEREDSSSNFTRDATLSPTTGRFINDNLEELSVFPSDNADSDLASQDEPQKKEAIAEILLSLKFYQQNQEEATSRILEINDDQIAIQPNHSEINNINYLNQAKVQILQMLLNSRMKITFDATVNKMDNSIIDIDSQSQLIDYTDVKQSETIKVPDWPHMYIYGYSDLERVSNEQKAFYDRFKVKFLTGKWVNLDGNSNYAFILLFDLLKQFNVHKNINVLEEHMEKISIYYPKTSSYAKKNLIQKMREIDYKEGLDRLERTTPNNIVPDYQAWDWKNRSIKVLSLGKEDAKLLDDFYINQNNFVGIEFCSLEIVKLYIIVRKSLIVSYRSNNLNVKDQFAIVLDLVARKQYNYRYNSQNYKYVLENNNQLVFAYIFKYCENKIRKLYDYKTLNLLQSYHEEVLISLTDNVVSFIENDITKHLDQVKKPDQETEQRLNSQVTTRWKLKLQLTTEYYQQIGKNAFLAEVNDILDQNVKNPSLETIYYELFKFLTPLDKQLAFEYFLRYTNQNLTTRTLVLKSMPQNLIKKLFSTPELQSRYFKIIMSLMKRDITIDNSLEEIKNFFLPQRKKIILNTQAIKQVEQQHSGTVEVLNEYLKDEENTEATIITLTTQEGTDNQRYFTVKSVESELYCFNTNKNEEALLHLFKENNFTVSSDQMDTFCKIFGHISGTLINNLNENCYDVIDDLLIETSETNYTINQTYYHQILKV